MPQIETARLCLRPFTAEDLDDLAGLLADPQVMRYLGQEGGQTMTRVEAADTLSKFMVRWRERGFGHFAVLLKATPKLIGLCGLKLLDDTPELIYILAHDHWGQGYAAEAACACLRYGFEEVGCERVVAVTRPENMASQRVLEKIGMRYERIVEHYGVVARQYALTRAEFQAGDSFYQFRRA
jgi:RimJ/RimL family protein N-acetyltransferase